MVNYPVFYVRTCIITRIHSHGLRRRARKMTPGREEDKNIYHATKNMGSRVTVSEVTI